MQLHFRLVGCYLNQCVQYTGFELAKKNHKVTIVGPACKSYANNEYSPGKYASRVYDCRTNYSKYSHLINVDAVYKKNKFDKKDRRYEPYYMYPYKWNK